VIILDTNVICEPLRARANAGVVAWLDEQAVESLFLTSVSLAELLLGVELLPKGRRRSSLGEQLDTLLSSLFENRILAFDREAARAYSSVVARARSAGVAISMPDAQIASLARVTGFAVATRDAAPFVAAGVAVVDPWSGGG
jgi:toxin FitB